MCCLQQCQREGRVGISGGQLLPQVPSEGERASTCSSRSLWKFADQKPVQGFHQGESINANPSWRTVSAPPRWKDESIQKVLSSFAIQKDRPRMLDLVQIAFEADGLSFTRIDGQTTLPKRMQALETFNNDPNCQIMLASIGSIGEG
jgi:hypothetical protein